jgi:hypothetical protein
MAVGEQLVLTLDDAYFAADSSVLPASFTAHDPVYVQVDSFDSASKTGSILEVDELTDVPYNNIVGPFFFGPASSMAKNGVKIK